MNEMENMETAADRVLDRIILALMLCVFIAMMQGYI